MLCLAIVIIFKFDTVSLALESHPGIDKHICLMMWTIDLTYIPSFESDLYKKIDLIRFRLVG